jgi:hypothetical protein
MLIHIGIEELEEDFRSHWRANLISHHRLIMRQTQFTVGLKMKIVLFLNLKIMGLFMTIGPTPLIYHQVKRESQFK